MATPHLVVLHLHWGSTTFLPDFTHFAAHIMPYQFSFLKASRFTLTTLTRGPFAQLQSKFGANRRHSVGAILEIDRERGREWGRGRFSFSLRIYFFRFSVFRYAWNAISILSMRGLRTDFPSIYVQTTQQTVTSLIAAIQRKTEKVK